MSDNEKREKIGGLWQSTDKNGNPYWTGEIRFRVIMFTNKLKEGNQPDVNMYLLPYQPKEEQQSRPAPEEPEIPF